MDPVTQAKILDEQTRSGVFLLSGRVTPDTTKRFQEFLAFHKVSGCRPLNIKIDCEGGSVQNGLFIHDELKAYPGKTTGYITSYANSMAPVIFQGCDERLMLPHATIFLHSVQRQLLVTYDELETTTWYPNLLMEMGMQHLRVLTVLSERTGNEGPVIDGWCRKKTTFNAQEAVELNLADAIYRNTKGRHLKYTRPAQ